MPLPTSTELIAHVPVEEKPALDKATVLTAAGIRVWCDVGRLPDRLYLEIDAALNAQAVAAGVNMPMGLEPGVWLKRCRRCNRPFIDLPHTRMCSDECRGEAKRDAALKSKAKRAKRAWREQQSDERGRFVCAQCGKRRQGLRRTRRFCSVRCRVAAHRGVPAQPPEPMTLKELDREIADVRSLLGAAQCGYLDAATLKIVLERGVALEAERRALAIASPSSP